MTSDYLEKRRRNQVKKMLRKQKPYLMGTKLDEEVDRVMGIADSGKMDWAMARRVKTSDYPTPDSVKEADVRAVASDFGLRPYKLYWFFLNKTTKLQASGSQKTDYYAVLKECAAPAINKELTDDEKITAVLLFAQFTNVSITRLEAEALLERGEI